MIAYFSPLLVFCDLYGVTYQVQQLRPQQDILCPALLLKSSFYMQRCRSSLNYELSLTLVGHVIMLFQSYNILYSCKFTWVWTNQVGKSQEEAADASRVYTKVAYQ